MDSLFCFQNEDIIRELNQLQLFGDQSPELAVDTPEQVDKVNIIYEEPKREQENTEEEGTFIHEFQCTPQ